MVPRRSRGFIFFTISEDFFLNILKSRGVARYFFFRSILMKSNFDTDTAEV